jgi:hypothetical protein
MSKDRMIKVVVPPKLELSDPAYNPAFDVDVPQYEWKTIAQYKQEKEVERHKYTIEWYEKHRQADAVVVNQQGIPLYALYHAPEAHHEEAVAHLFKSLRAIKYFDDEVTDMELDQPTPPSSGDSKPPSDTKSNIRGVK